MADTNFAESKEFESDDDTEETLAEQQESTVRDAGDSILAEFLHGPLNKTVTPNSQRKTQEDHRKFCQYVYFWDAAGFSGCMCQTAVGDRHSQGFENYRE